MTRILLFLATLTVMLVGGAPAAKAEEPPSTVVPIGPTGQVVAQTVATPTPTVRGAGTVSTPLATRAPEDLRPLMAMLPTPMLAPPQPSAYFVPRVITVTAGYEGLAGARLQGRVLDWKGNGLGGAAVRAEAGEGGQTVPTRQDGSYAIDGLPAGVYSVTVAGYEGLAASPLPIDGRNIFIVEFVESTRPTTPTPTGTATAQSSASATPASLVAAVGQRQATATPAAGGTARPTAAGPPRGTPTPKPEAPLLSDSDLEYLAQTWLTPFLLGAAGAYIIFLVGIFGAGLRR